MTASWPCIGCWRASQPAQLAGTLIVIPVANPSAFGAGQRHTPIDGADLNRVFPGRVDGSVTERLAHQLCHDVLRHMDLVFTLHGARSPNRLMEWIEFLDDRPHASHARKPPISRFGLTGNNLLRLHS